MSYFEKTRILSADSPSIDAFGKWRVSQPTTLFDSKQVVDSGSFYFDIKTTSGGTVTWNSGSAQSTMAVTSTSGSRAIKQTKRIFVYQPGKSQQIICTGKFGTKVDGIKKSIGSFDDNDGYFFQTSGSSFGVVLRILIYVHEINNYNSLDTVYLRNPNLPIRYEMSTHKNTTTGSLMTQICSTVISEGGFDNTGKRVVVTSNNGATIGASEYDAVLFIRYNSSTSKGAQIVPEQLDLLIKPGNSSTFAGRWELLVNPTVTNAVTYNNASGSIVTQVAVVAAGNVITNPGTIIATGYFAGTSANSVAQMIVLDPYYGLGRKIDGTSDVLAVGIKTIDNTYTVYPSLIVRELI